MFVRRTFTCGSANAARRAIVALARPQVASGMMAHQKGAMVLPTMSATGCFKQQIKFYSHAPPLTKEIIGERIIELLESYNKVKPGVEIGFSSTFSKDLGLDSFDIVEVIMELEYEFSIIIPDSEADAIKTVGQAVEYISQQPDAC